MTDRDELFEKIGKALGTPVVAGDVCLTDETSGHMLVVRKGKLLWFLDENRVNLDDLLNGDANGKIVRCDGNPHECVMVYQIVDEI